MDGEVGDVGDDAPLLVICRFDKSFDCEDVAVSSVLLPGRLVKRCSLLKMRLLLRGGKIGLDGRSEVVVSCCEGGAGD
jgi:hypothetical protein